ncbi:hypothetical protein LTR95_009408 [Oleoguttula sp. CCFEE 5521]
MSYTALDSRTGDGLDLEIRPREQHGLEYVSDIEMMHYKATPSKVLDATIQYTPVQPRSMDDPVDSQDTDDVQYTYDKATSTLKMCIFALCCCWLIGIVCITLGVIAIIKSNASENALLAIEASEIAALGLNVGVTLLIETTGFIHTASLRSSLQQEGKLKFNTNLRLITCARLSRPNRWYINIVVLLFITLAYAASSLVFMKPNLALVLGPGPITWQGFLCIVLGCSLVGLAAISTWALMSSSIPSWSSSPFDSVLVAAHSGLLERTGGRCLRSVHDSQAASVPVHITKTQKSAWKAHGQVKLIVGTIWLPIALYAALVGLVVSLDSRVQNNGRVSWSLVPGYGTVWSRWTLHASLTQLGVRLVTLLIFVALQSPLTFALHCSELLVNLWRDEDYWRTATTRRGARLRGYSSVKATLTSWQSVLLFIFKSLLHWILGLSISIDALVSIFCVCFASFMTYLSLAKPLGTQPATFGHVQTILDLVDEWHPTIYWGHKGENDGICHAGTSAHKLPGVRWNGLYSGDAEAKTRKEK